MGYHQSESRSALIIIHIFRMDGAWKGLKVRSKVQPLSCPGAKLVPAEVVRLLCRHFGKIQSLIIHLQVNWISMLGRPKTFSLIDFIGIGAVIFWALNPIWTGGGKNPPPPRVFTKYLLANLHETL